MKWICRGTNAESGEAAHAIRARYLQQISARSMGTTGGPDARADDGCGISMELTRCGLGTRPRNTENL